MYNQNPYFNMMYQPPAQRLQQYEQFQDPAFSRAMQMAQGKSPQQIEQIVKNLCGQRGIDYEQFKQTFNQK